MIIKKEFQKAPFIDNPYKDIYYIDFVEFIVYVYKKIETNSFFSFLDKNRNKKYELIGQQKFELDTETSNKFKIIDELKKEIFEYDKKLNYFKLSNLNNLNDIVDKLDENDIYKKDDLLKKDLYIIDLDLEKLSLLMREKNNRFILDKLEHNKEMKIASVTGIFSGCLLAEEIKLGKIAGREIVSIIEDIINKK